MIIFIAGTIFVNTLSSCQKATSGNQKTQASGERLTLSPEVPRQAALWSQLVGEWDCVSKDLDMRREDNTKWFTNKGTWKWEYILGGRALLNNWWQEDVSPNPVSTEFFAAGVFIYNPRVEFWEAVVMNSRASKISEKFQLVCGEEAITMGDETGRWQVVFYNLEANSFEWKYELLNNDGSWRSISEISAKRKS